MSRGPYHKSWHPSYTLYIRKRDHALSLIEQETRRLIACSVIRETRVGIFLRLRGAYGVFLMEDEIRMVEELPPKERVGVV